MGKYQYKTGNVTHKGVFNIYQARSGAIMLVMANTAVELTFKQIDELPINCYELDDFNADDFHQYYVEQSVGV